MLFAIPIALFFFLFFQFPELLSVSMVMAIKSFGIIVFYVWMFSLIDYFRIESNSDKWGKLLKILVVGIFIMSFDASINGGVIELILLIVSLILWIVFVVLLSGKIKRVLYGRSRWFIFIELFFPVIGILTLTPEIKRWEKSDKT
jgi:hypothetical protein